MDPILIFLAIAMLIIAVAIFVSRAFRKTIQRDKQFDDPNGNPRDGEGAATWIGVDEGDHR